MQEGPGIAGAFGSVMGFLGQERMNAANQRQADRQMAFQREMSNTQYQRAADDMEKAGINRILAGRYGGSSPSGAMAQMGSSMQQAVTTGFGASKAQSDIELQGSQKDINELSAIIKKPDATKAEVIEIAFRKALKIIDESDKKIKDPKFQKDVRSVFGALTSKLGNDATRFWTEIENSTTLPQKEKRKIMTILGIATADFAKRMPKVAKVFYNPRKKKK